jgi:regulator of protease activity HflC (stomatin/prohibitin superfamily)
MNSQSEQPGVAAALKRPRRILAVLVALYVVLYFAPQIFITIHPGEAGVLFRRFAGGTDTEHVYGEGFHVIWPWDQMSVYNARVQQSFQHVDVLTKNGLTVDLGVSIQYRPERDVLGRLHQDIGPDYLRTIVIPEVTQTLRAEFGKYTAEEFFSSKRPILSRVRDESVAQVGPRYVTLEDVIVQTVQLPPAIQRAIEGKIEQQHLAEAYEFQIVQEQQEAKRKEIEAMGYKTYNETIASSLTPGVLQWKGIEATRELAASPNSKVIVVGNGPSGLPIILGGEK